MSLTSDLMQLADLYCDRTQRSRSRVATIIFNDGKKLDLIAGGADLTTRSFENAISWFSANWPADLDWPDGIERPPFRADALIPVAAPSVGAPLPDALIEALNHQAPRGAK